MRDSLSAILDSPFARRLERTVTGHPYGSGLDTTWQRVLKMLALLIWVAVLVPFYARGRPTVRRKSWRARSASTDAATRTLPGPAIRVRPSSGLTVSTAIATSRTAINVGSLATATESGSCKEN